MVHDNHALMPSDRLACMPGNPYFLGLIVVMTPP